MAEGMKGLFWGSCVTDTFFFSLKDRLVLPFVVSALDCVNEVMRPRPRWPCNV